jgi:hypothetical protein
MQGCLTLKEGVLYVGRHELTAHVRPYDLDGRPLSAGFSFRGPAGEPVVLGGLDIDDDHHLWIADSAAGCVRSFSVFGREVRSFAGSAESERDERGSLGAPVDVAVVGRGDESVLAVATAGWRRHAVQLFRPDGHWIGSLRPQGSSVGRFHGVRRVAALGRMLYVCETRAGRVQVYRDGEFHFAFSLPVASAGRFEPASLAPLADGRLVIAAGGLHSGLLLVDPAGRLQAVLAERGEETGRVVDPGDVAVEEVDGAGATRIAVIDRDAERVQVFTLDGRCFGALERLPGQAL